MGPALTCRMIDKIINALRKIENPTTAILVIVLALLVAICWLTSLSRGDEDHIPMLTGVLTGFMIFLAGSIPLRR